VRSPEPDATPLILTHGWPNTFLEYVDLVAPLTDPRGHGGQAADAFHVVVPDLPGFGFSGPTREPGWDARRTARAWAELMRRLGYDRHGVHGNDAGAIVAPWQGRVDPEHVIGVHVTQLFSFPSGDPAELTNTAASAARFYYENQHAEQPTGPTTVPVGLASFAFDFRPIRRFADRDHANIVSWSEFDRGSHWAAHDAPDLLLGDIRQFFRTLR